MAGMVSWTIRFDVDPERWDEFTALVPTMIESASQEPGTASLEWFADADAHQAHVLERYDDEDAARAHTEHYTTRFAATLEPMVTATSFFVYGDPSLDLAADLRDGGATILRPLDGYRR